MSPELLSLDEVPNSTDDDNLGSDVPAGSVPCPECGEYFKSRGLTRHMVQSHGMAPPTRRTATSEPGKANVRLAQQWAEFQRGAALFISFACVQCAAIVVEDAQTDGDAIAAFCEGRPKLKKQIQQALSGMDIMILVGALGGTARKMLAHHDIGKKIGLAGPHTHTMERGSPEQQVMSFLTSIPESDRNLLLNHVFNQMATANAPTAPPPNVTVVTDQENTPGAPPPPDTSHITPQDEYMMAMAHNGGGEFVESGI